MRRWLRGGCCELIQVDEQLLAKRIADAVNDKIKQLEIVQREQIKNQANLEQAKRLRDVNDKALLPGR